MSRSRKKTAMCGYTTARSEKEDKAIVHRRIRRCVVVALRKDPVVEVLPHDKEFDDPWLMAKDGKQRFDPEKFPKEMRK